MVERLWAARRWAARLEELRPVRGDIQEQTVESREVAAPKLVAIAPVLHSISAALRLGADGSVRREPPSTGWRRLASLALAGAASRPMRAYRARRRAQSA
ncbi:hypothetical protein ACH4VR_27145 [Streptomyces sp. NPDC020883]|uniref:hypothetical protein n=1 Tax=Streptomyces sp. NPDC020883 TaxID=3365099 RepID=UPI00378E8951